MNEQNSLLESLASINSELDKESANASVGYIGSAGDVQPNAMVNNDMGMGMQGASPYSISEDNDGVEESLNNMFAAILIGGVDKKDAEVTNQKIDTYRKSLNIFLSKFMYNIFENEYALFYDIMTTLKVKVFSRKQLETIIDNNVDTILASGKINLSAYSVNLSGGATSDEEKIEAFKLDVMQKFIDLSYRQVMFEEFESSCKIFIEHYKNKMMLETSQNMALIMTIGFVDKSKGRGKLLKGFEDCSKYYNDRIAIMRSLEEENAIRATIIDESWLEKEYQKDAGAESDIIMDTGIDEIDSVHGMLHRGNMVEVLGPPKGGKTTLATWLVERGLERGLNVAIWPLEGEKDEWTALIQSLMIRKGSSGKYIDKKRIFEREFESDEERQEVLSARHALAGGDTTRGKLSFIEGLCYVEKMQDDLEHHYNTENPFDIIVLDSPLLALSLTGKGKVDRIGECFTILKNFVSNKLRRKALCIVTAQLKQSVVDKLRMNPKETIDVTAGGESAETIRTPDYVFGVFSTKAERNQGMIKIHDVAVRHGASFDDCYIGAELGCGYFYSDPALNNK